MQPDHAVMGFIEELVLDWNGTVVADRARACEATNAVLQQYERPWLSEADFARCFTLPLSRFFERLGVPTQHLGEAEALWNRRSGELPASLSRGASELLTAARTLRIPIGIVTAADPEIVGADATRLGIRNLLSWVVGPSHDKAADLARTARTGRRVAYIGDTVDDIVYARRAGVVAIALLGGYHGANRLQRAQPDLSLNNLAEMIPLLSRARAQVAPSSGHR